MNREVASQILKSLSQQGVSTLCICPGARSAPFIDLLNQDNPFEVISFFDERSAGFFAMGRARRDQRPVAVITTSGTAVSELLSPTIEAFYNSTPLVVISADRPKRLRGTGAPQAIRQNDLLESYCKKTWDIENQTDFDMPLPVDGPSHINVCFDEPLVDLGEPVEFIPGEVTKKSLPNPHITARTFENCLVIVSGLNESNKSNIENQLSKINNPIFLEASSGLRNSQLISSQIISGGEKYVGKLLKSGVFKSVLRIGDVPLGRYWRDLDKMSLPVLSLSEKQLSGLGQGELFHCDLSQVSFENFQFDFEDNSFAINSKKVQADIVSMASQFPQSEPQFFNELSQSGLDNIYIGNSLPVRLWDLFDQSSLIPKVNRGANGIDGQISTAFGEATFNSKINILIGDLTALYGQNALWLTSYLKKNNIKANLFVVNNKGGKIFNRIFESDLYCNNHDLTFEGMAMQWGWTYQKINQYSEISHTGDYQLIEFVSDNQQSQLFWEEYNKLWH